MRATALPPLALNYHGVLDVPVDAPMGWLFVRPRDLRRHIERLQGWGHELVTFGELARRALHGEANGCVSLTFDDGVADDGALLQTLRETGAAATVFAVSGWLGRPCPYAPSTRIVTAEELRQLAAAGIEIGAHSVTHPDLSALSYEDARKELVDSKAALETVLELPVTVAAYPFGRATAETRRACCDAGFLFACRSEGRGSWDDRYDIPRFGMGNGSTVLSLRLKRDPRYSGILDRRTVHAAQRVLKKWQLLTRKPGHTRRRGSKRSG
jgi:peptidoglycan/xylan/chitin deacetylase (PgdA/CDA1 family)